MLSYRHAFHAGNVGDVLKHAVLALLIEALKRKEAPFVCLESHAGAGRYDLLAEQAQKTGEYREGIARLWERAGEAPDSLRPYLDAVGALNPGGTLRFYPGSPRIARHLLRPGDRMALMELHPADHALLKQEFAGDRQVGVHLRDGYEALNAFLPPKERRGLLFIDPSYEVKEEYARVITALREAHKRWPGGLYALWYPVLARAATDAFKERLRQSGIPKILDAELTTRPDGAVGMVGSGMLLINPPWQLDRTLSELLPWLRALLSPDGSGHARVEWLVPETPR